MSCQLLGPKTISDHNYSPTPAYRGEEVKELSDVSRQKDRAPPPPCATHTSKRVTLSLFHQNAVPTEEPPA